MTRRKLLLFLAYGEVPRFGLFPASYDGWVKSRVRDEYEMKKSNLYAADSFTFGSEGTIVALAGAFTSAAKEAGRAASAMTYIVEKTREAQEELERALVKAKLELQ